MNQRRAYFWILMVTVNVWTWQSSLGSDRSQGRSMVITPGGMVAAEHPLASQAGALILAQGGHAVDAALAANAAMGVLSPMMCGIGGDLFALVYEAKTGRLHGLNGSGWSPAAWSLESLKEQGHEKMPMEGIHAVTVPGAVDGWDKLLGKFGRKSFAEILAPAIQYAERGFPVTELVADYWSGEEEVGKLRGNPEATRVFLPGGKPPAVGELFRNPDLARSYGEIAAGGREAFYNGAIAERILETARRLGGGMREEDLREYSSEWVEPISTTYRGWTVYEMPPNGQGIAALSMLNLMEQFPLGDLGHNSAATLHILIEAKKLAYGDLIRHVADPRSNPPPVEAMLSKEYARERARLIDMNQAQARAGSGLELKTGADTTYISVVDKEGNMVSLIQSIYFLFGSGIVSEGTGFTLQNRGGGFSFDPEHPNVVGGRKRPLHTIIPGFMTKEEKRIAFGIMGGWNQAQAHAQFVSNVADHGMNIQSALEAARFTKATFEGKDVQMEGRISAEARGELAGKGHDIEVRGDFSQVVGGGQAVLRDKSAGVNYGASDPRKDGAAIPAPY